ncbi:MAG: serine/threonine-protein kinase [Phycisphaeraceae bacterium]
MSESSSNHGSSSNKKVDTLLGRLVVDKGLASQEDVDRCVESLRGDAGEAKDKSLAQALIEAGVVTRQQIDRLRPEAETHRAGQQIPGYQIVSKLGSGAMATVYKARQLSLDRMVAIKVLPPSQTKEPQFVERFYAEGRAAAKLNHANIVQAIDVGQSGEFHYFVMEYVEGFSVFDELMKNGRYEESRALEIGTAVARALEHAHAQGFIHRDVKPKNIMINKDGVPKLADMGLARAVSDREAAEAEAGKAYGTPYYISPEQIRGKVDVDFRADIYGLGATLYHMVTGRVPFEAPNPSAVMHKHLKEELVPPDHVNSELSSGLSEIIEVCMAKERKKRYHTTADLLADLELVAKGEPPAQARRAFDVSQLSDLEASGIAAAQPPLAHVQNAAVSQQPLFWIAIAGWLVAAILLIIVVILALAP